MLHTQLIGDGTRLGVSGRNPTRAYAPAAGLVATPRDLALLFESIAPDGPSSLSPALKAQLTVDRGSERDRSGRHYGLDVHIVDVAGCQAIENVGMFQGSISRTLRLPAIGVTFTVAVNATNEAIFELSEGIVHVLRWFSDNWSPAPAESKWRGRWRNPWGPIDLTPIGDQVVVSRPADPLPFSDPIVIKLDGADHGTIVSAPGTDRYGEAARLDIDGGVVTGVHLGSAGFTTAPRARRLVDNLYGAEAAS